MNVAFIPVRGGSKSIPLKNIKPICGRPLVYWTVRAACTSKYIDKVFVSTDSEKIREAVESFKTGPEATLFAKVCVIGRSAESASDTATTEFAMLEFASSYEFDNIALIQATSPLLQAADIDKGFDTFALRNTDSVLSVVRQKRFHWSCDSNGIAHPTNYDVYKRPRRQEFAGYYVENGALYITSRTNLLSSKNRVSGNIKVVEMSEDTFFEIDEPTDWIIIEALMQKSGISASVVIPQIKMFLTDCDGCLTDGGMYYSENGDELKKFNTRDGMGFEMLRKRGVLTGIITSEKVELNRRRAKKLAVDILEEGCKDKESAIKGLCKKYEIAIENVCYIGDDVNDLGALKAVGFSCCPSDAIDDVKRVVKYVALSKGGTGVCREVVDYLCNTSIDHFLNESKT